LKYICTIDEDDKREIFTFPRSVNHDAMAEALDGIRDQTHGNWRRIFRVPVSAGFVDAYGNCYGNSETLGLESQEEDTKLLALDEVCGVTLCHHCSDEVEVGDPTGECFSHVIEA